MQYEVVLFDADDTLYDYSKSEAYALLHTCEDYHIEVDHQVCVERYRTINQQLWDDFEKRLITQVVLRHERFSRLFQELQLDINEHEFSNRYLYYLGQGSFLIDGAEEICKYLQEKYRLVIVTNGIKEVQLSRIHKSELQPYFEEIVVSEDAGYQKPDVGIFNYMLEKIKFSNKEKMLIIGDSLSSDIQGGVNYGMDTCWFNPGHKPNRTGIRPKYEIHDLLELKQFL